MFATKLGDGLYTQLDRMLDPVDKARAAAYPGIGARRQPTHTLYVPADRYHEGIALESGAAAIDLMNQYLPDADTMAALLDIDVELASLVYPRVIAKLGSEPVEDLRVDFEDGYGGRDDATEDADAVRSAVALRADFDAGRAPSRLGLRIKGLEPAGRRRGLRTLDLVLTSLLDTGDLPDGWVITLPKVTSVEQVAAFDLVCSAWEQSAGLSSGALRFEIQVETPQAILDARGSATVARMVHAARGRLSGLHYGTYDYSAACGVVAGLQSLDHPVADHAKAVMQLAAASTGVQVSDGSSNVLPVGDRDAVHLAWRLHARLVRHSLTRAIYQGWDLHHGQLVTRYAATFAFYRRELPAAANRLRDYLSTGQGGVLEEPATAQAMASVLVRGLQCGAIDADEVTARTGVDMVTLLALYQRSVG